MLKYVATTLSPSPPLPASSHAESRSQDKLANKIKYTLASGFCELFGLRVCCYWERGKGCGFRAEGRNQSRHMQTQGLPATGFLSFNYKDHKCDKWSVTRTTAERKWGKEIGLAPAEEHSTTCYASKGCHKLLREGKQQLPLPVSSISAYTRWVYGASYFLLASLQYPRFKSKRGWKQQNAATPGYLIGACTTSFSAASPGLGSQCTSQPLGEARQKRRACKTLLVEGILLPTYLRHAGTLREKLVAAIHSDTFRILTFRVSLTPAPLKAVSARCNFTWVTYCLIFMKAFCLNGMKEK